MNQFEDERVRKRVFYVLAALAIVITFLFTYSGKNQKPQEPKEPKPAISGQETALSTDSTEKQVYVQENVYKSPRQYEPLKPNEKAKVEKTVRDFARAFGTSPAGDTPEQYKSRIKPFLTEKMFQELGEIPVAENPTRVLAEPYLQQEGNYRYKVFLTLEEIFEGKATKVNTSITVKVDKVSGLISDVKFR